ncbi:MAG: hypothetical protein IMZ55_00590 [Acidobacteria bacterium]|nr:hypothetical protein [Acidobacteriota bacterium]
MRPPDLPPHRRRVHAALCVTVPVLLLIPLPGCGKRGPPLAPIARVPARIDALAARRLGPVVYLDIRVPDRDQDGSAPADVARLEVYGYTGDPGSTANFLKNGTLVATLPVRRPPDPGAKPAAGAAKPGQAGTAAAKAPKVQPGSAAGFDQGATAIVTETLTPRLLMPVVVEDRRRPRAAPLPLPMTPPLWGPPGGGVPGRVYIVVGYNHKRQRGAPSIRVSVPLCEAPQAPAPPALSYAEDRFVLTWQAPPTARQMVQAPASAVQGVLASTPLVDVLPASAYNVYEIDAAAKSGAGAGEAPPAPGGRSPVPLNEKPLEVLTFEDVRLAFGVERCYAVRTVDSVGPGQVVESESSAVACATPRDTFPPRAPASLDAIATEGAISLIWDANTESDLAGYLVLRGAAPGSTMERLTPAPIRETTYRDATARSGVRYVYAVVAVDTATPPNVSPPSNKVEEVAR